MQELILICLVFFVAGVVQGVVGFGFAVATTLILINRMDFTTLVFLNLCMSLVTSIIAMMSGSNLKMIDRAILVRLCIMSFVGLIIALYIMEWVNPLILKQTTLTVILFASVISLFKNKNVFAKSWMVWISGFTSGLLTPSTGINGPMVALHLNAALSNKVTKRVTMLAYLCFIMGAGVLLMSFQKDFTSHTWSLLGKVILPSIAGYGVGLWSFGKLSNHAFKLTITIFLIVSSLISLLYLLF